MSLTPLNTSPNGGTYSSSTLGIGRRRRRREYQIHGLLHYASWSGTREEDHNNRKDWVKVASNKDRIGGWMDGLMVGWMDGRILLRSIHRAFVFTSLYGNPNIHPYIRPSITPLCVPLFILRFIHQFIVRWLP